MAPAEEILAFSKTRPAWQQDALRRLFTQVEFSDRDLREVLGMLRGQFGLANGTVPEPVPLAASHIPQKSGDTRPVTLNSVGNVLNANRLANGQLLQFGIAGLTVVYGDNGSGKSGYCRILKKLCRVREGGEEDIRANAFDPLSVTGKAEATVRFTVGDGELLEVRWKSGTEPPDKLSRVSVFDAKIATIYADQQNRIEFLPHGLDVLHRLGEVCEKVAAQVDAERSRVEQRIAIPLPTVPVGTSAALLTARLSKTTPVQDLPTKEQIETTCAWTGEDGDALEDRQHALLGDPETLAKRCRHLITTVEVVERELRALGQKLDDTVVGQCRNAWEAAKAAREAATMAASQATTTDLLPGFGANAWRLLFQYARDYSATAYSGEPFPVTRDGARCVLCQQPLGRDAIQRFETFDRYVRGAAEADAAEQERKRDAAKDGTATLLVREPADARTMLAGLAGEDAEAVGITEGVVEYLTTAGTRKSAIGAAFADGKWEGLPTLAELPLDTLAAAKARLFAKAMKHEANCDPEARKVLEGSVTELRAKNTLSASREAVLRRREDLDTLSRLNHCKAGCDTKGISRKNSELRRQYLTKDFEDRLFEEIRELDLAYIPFKVQERSDHGASFLGVGLEAVVKVKNHDILSDGEFRALALACFLTEVNSIAGHNGVIVDDPVSSLDHLRAHVVALRLVREAQMRQVIVFTHDLVFYHELYDAAAELGVPIVCHWIRRTEEHGFGTIAGNEAPWQAKSVAQRVDALNQKLAALRRMDPGAGESFRRSVKDFYTDVRETWERLVEELLLNGTVSRFQLGVKTQSLGGISVSDNDHKRVFFGMRRASLYSGHDRAQGAQVSPPKADEMQRDIDSLKSYADELRKRNKKLEGERRKLEKPTRGTTA